MFYCDPCAEKTGWARTMFKSRGKCEVCGLSTACNDRPSKDLPPSKIDLGEVSPVDGVWHSIGPESGDGHWAVNCSGDHNCPVIVAGYDTLLEPDTIKRRPHGFDAALFEAWKAGVAWAPVDPRERTDSESRASYKEWREAWQR